MKILNKNFKLFLFGFFMFFLGYYCLNFVDLVHLRNRTLFENSNRLIKLNLNDLKIKNVQNRRPNSSAFAKTMTPTRYLAYDGGGFSSIDTTLLKCSNEIEISITDNIDNLNSIDIFYFHMNAPEKIKYTKSLKKKQYFMVYTMESEVN